MESVDLVDFHRELLAEVFARSGAAGRFAADSFFEIVTEELVALGELETADRAYHEAPSLRVDGYAFDPAVAGELTVIVSEFEPSDDPPQTMTAREMSSLLKKSRNFIERALDADWRSAINESSAGAALAALVADGWNRIHAIRIVLISNRPLSSRVKTIDDESLHGKPVTHLVWDLARLQELRASGSAREKIAIDLMEEFGEGIPTLRVGVRDELYEGYLASINGRMLATLFKRYGARLLEQNVRVFLQARGKVNKGIRDTIRDNPDRFFAYNNGITATAGSVKLRETRRGSEIVSIEDLQIVNGGQTTSSLHAALGSTQSAENLSRISVQMKLAVLRSEDIETMVPLISQYANSQNKVSEADFDSNHQYHLEMKAHSERVLAPRSQGAIQQTRWFFERARGQYADQRNRMSASKWKAFQAEHPKDQVLTKTDVAKFDMVWRQLPHKVSGGAQKNFKDFMDRIRTEWERDPALFHAEYFKRMVAKAIVFRHAENLVSEASWYSGGYRANIVAYSIARVAKAIADAGRIPELDSIWGEQRVGVHLNGLLLDVIEPVHRALNRTPANKSNVSEWAKDEKCWDAIAAQVAVDPVRVRACSVPKDEFQQSNSEAKKDQVVLTGAAATIEVANRGSPAWQRLHLWAKGRHFLTPKEAQIVEIATDPVKSLSEKQAPIALKAWERARRAGWGG
jgi:hypothetical protein